MYLVLSELARARPQCINGKQMHCLNGRTDELLDRFFKQTNKLNKQKTNLTSKWTYYFLRDRQSCKKDINASMTMNFMFWGFRHKLYTIRHKHINRQKRFSCGRRTVRCEKKTKVQKRHLVQIHLGDSQKNIKTSKSMFDKGTQWRWNCRRTFGDINLDLSWCGVRGTSRDRHEDCLALSNGWRLSRNVDAS